MGNSVKRNESSPVTEEHGGLDTYDGITPNVFMIERLACAYVEYEDLELMPINIVVHLAWFCQALHLELCRRDTWRAGSTKAKRPLCRGGRPTCEMIDDGGNGCTRWARAKVNWEDRKGLGANVRRVVTGSMGTTGPLGSLAARTIYTSAGIGHGLSTIDLFEFINGGKNLGELYGSKKGRARRRRGRGRW
jgi:hypothetical protein